MRYSLRTPLLLSLALHGAILVMVIEPAQKPEPHLPQPLQTPPLLITLRSHQVLPTDGAKMAPSITDSKLSSPANPENSLTSDNRDRHPLLPDIPSTEAGGSPAGVPPVETVTTTPLSQSTDSIRAAVRSVLKERDDRLRDCTPRQRISPLFDCDMQDTVDFDQLAQNRVAEALRSRATEEQATPAVSRLAADADLLRERLERVGDETLQVRGFIRQLHESASIRTRTTQSERAQDLLQLNDATAQLRNRIMGHNPVRLQQ